MFLTGLGIFALAIIIGSIILIIAEQRKSKGLLGRAANLAEGKADKAMESLEKSDPEAVFRAAIGEGQKELAELNQMSKEVKGLEFQEKQKAENLEKEKEELKGMLETAVEQEEEDLGGEILEKIESLDERIKEHKNMSETYRKQGEDTVKMRNDKKKELDELKVEMKTASNVTKSEEIVTRIRDRKNGMANDAISRGLESARDKTAESKAALQANKDIEDNSIENKMAKLKEAGAKSKGKNKMAEMIAAKKAKLEGKE